MGGREVVSRRSERGDGKGEREREREKMESGRERVKGPPYDTDHPSVVYQWFSQRFAPASLLCCSVICLGRSLVRIIAWLMSQDQ